MYDKRKWLEEFDPDNLPDMENLDGSDIAEEEQKESFGFSGAAVPVSAAKPSAQPPKKLYDDPAHKVEASMDPYGAYQYADEGRQVVKAVAIIIMVISAAALIFHIVNGRWISVFAAAFRIFAGYKMMNGRNWARIVLIVFFAVLVYSDFVLLFGDAQSTERMQIFYTIMLIIHCTLEYFICFDRQVKAFFGKW